MSPNPEADPPANPEPDPAAQSAPATPPPAQEGPFFRARPAWMRFDHAKFRGAVKALAVVVMTLLVMAVAAPALSGLFSEAWWYVFPPARKLYIDSPEVYTRERL